MVRAPPSHVASPRAQQSSRQAASRQGGDASLDAARRGRVDPSACRTSAPAGCRSPYAMRLATDSSQVSAPFCILRRRSSIRPAAQPVTPVVVPICSCSSIRWLNTARVISAVLLGVAVYGLALFEPTALIAGLLFSVLVIHRVASGRLPMRTALLHIGAALLSFAATYVAMIGWFGFDLFSAFAAVARDAAQFNVKSGRPYAIWVWQNLFDIAFGVGWCQTVLFAAALVDGVVRWPSRWRLTDVIPIVLICVSVLAMVGIADAIGVNRGEVTRLWIFLACLAQIPAAYVCRRLGSAFAFGLVIAWRRSFKPRLPRRDRFRRTVDFSVACGGCGRVTSRHDLRGVAWPGPHYMSEPSPPIRSLSARAIVGAP